MRHDFCDGKYTVINDNGRLTALRNGEPWGRDLVGDNLVYWMLIEVDRLKVERDALRADAARLDWFADHVLSVRDEDWRLGREEWTLDSDSGLYRGNTIREAIDNAMRAALQQPKEPTNG